jgi:Cation transporter/ATPase, N-terminus
MISIEEGLHDDFAEFRLKKDGPNVVTPTKVLPLWAKLLLSLVSGFAPLLWVACFLVFLAWK